jgi:hypothetical protein
MRVGGSDFSGAKSTTLYYAVGELEGDTLTVERVATCDERMDLWHALIAQGGVWGLDFPFSLPAVAYRQLGADNWRDALEIAVSSTRKGYATLLDAVLGHDEGRCSTPSLFCRATDAITRAYSPLKAYNPSLSAMMYAAQKLLAYAVTTGASVYPLWGAGASASVRLHEVYPSLTWARVGMRRTPYLGDFVARFNALGGVQVVLPSGYGRAETQDEADSVVACVMMADAHYHHSMFLDDWAQQPPFATPEEWEVAHLEGVIVRT